MWAILLSTVLPLLIGALPAVVKEIATAKQNRDNAVTERERIEAEERVKALEARRDVLISESKSPWNIIGRLFLMLPFGLFIWKVVVWDKMLHYGSTEDLSTTLWALMFTVFGFYFVTDITRILKR